MTKDRMTVMERVAGWVGGNLRRTGIAAAALVMGSSLAAAEELKPVTIVLPGSSAMAWYPMIVAQQQGFFAEEGLDVTIKSLDGSGAVLQAMAAGRAEFGAPGPGPVLNAVARGADVKFFYNLFSRGLFMLAGDRNDGITSAEGLRGKQIGVSTADGAEVSFARSALASVGVQPDEYKFVTIGQEGMAVTAFQRDTIHAFAASFTGIAVLKDRGVDVFDLTPEGLDLFGNGLAVRGDIYRDSPEMVAGFAKAVHKATLWGMKNPDGVLKDGETYNPQEVERAAYARALLETVNQQYMPIGSNKLGYLPASGWDAWHKSLLTTGELDAPIEDLSVVYTNEFVENLGDE
ncbi:ABC transporter substrate-binding protein [Stappia indica]|uniref:ABC transporter substrate-binding protein n=1 Tax=Stappia indica TaxID=538381 RepID=UPI001CD3C020|nr:ABC transporter substrate-binding protein [Stappia indica]MCA1296860.1 ABC transporter substrate-binding protein [Stappia indica]